MKDFRLPLPELTNSPQKARHDAIAAYAAKMAGTDLDLDRDLESAGIDHLVECRQREHDEALQRLKAKLERGAAQAERGELLDGDEVFEELREMIEERRRAKAPVIFSPNSRPLGTGL